MISFRFFDEKHGRVRYILMIDNNGEKILRVPET